MTDTTIAPPQTTLAQDQARAANQGKPGYDVFGDPVKGAPLAAGGADSTGKPPLIVTSGSSRTQYNDNVTKMNTAIANTSAGAGSQQFNYVDKAGKMQVVNANSSDEALQKITSLGADPHSGVSEIPKPEVKTNADGSTVTTNPDGTSVTKNADGSSTSTTTDGMNLPTDVKKQYDDVIANADTVLQQRQADIDAAKATVTNDPAAAAALDSIKRQYDVLINAMKEKNKMLLGGYQLGQARSGAMQFANEMSSNFMSEEMDKSNGRISDLVAKENDLLLKTTIAYKTGDVKALNAAQNAYEKANTDKLKAIGDLVKATADHVKTVQNQQKIDAAAAKQKVTDDIRISTSIGKSVADTIAKSGVTDPAKIDQYIQNMAASSGIGNVETLRSAVVKARQDQGKLDLSAANTADTIKNRDAGTVIKQQNANKKKTTPTPKGGTDGAYTYTADDVASYTNLLNKGGTAPDGTKYSGRGKADQFVDPGAYVAALNDWVGNGGTPAGFVKKFPVAGNVNPASYSLLPAAIQPKAKAAAATPPLPTN